MSLTSESQDPELWEQKENRQNKKYLVLPPEEIAKGLVRPLRTTYIHTKCGAETKMATEIAETYARDPKFYGETFCVGCGKHFPVSEFKWIDGTTLGS